MPYVISAQCAKEIGVYSQRLKRWPFLQAVWRGISFLLIGVCYVGIFFAGFFVDLLPFELLRMWKLTPSETSYWIVAAVNLTAIVGLSGFLAIAIYRHLKVRHVNIDLIVLLGGSVLAIWYASRALPAGW